MTHAFAVRHDYQPSWLGMVEAVGPNRITGWVETQVGVPTPPINLFLNGVCIAETECGREHAFADGSRPVGFAISIAGSLPLMGKGDVLEVRCGEQRLPIQGHGARFEFRRAAKSQSDKLLERVAQGWMLDRKGKMRPPLGAKPAWKREAFDLLDRVGVVVERVTGAPLTIAYGTLLGCVREGDFIKHDDDFDTFYISKHSTPEAVSNEFADVYQALIDEGFAIRFGVHHPNLAVVFHPDGHASIDIFYAWFGEDDLMGVSYGYHGRPVHRDEAVGGMVAATLAGHPVQIPAFSERILEQKYGETWRIPDQGFAHKTDSRKFDKRFHVDAYRAERLYWNAFYARTSLTEASTFARLVATDAPADGLMIDVGSGTGKDTIFFAQKGFTAIGADASAQGVASAGKLAEERGLKTCEFQVVDVSSRDDLDALFASPTVQAAVAAKRPITVYMRFFLHSISQESEAVLFNALRDHLPAGSRLAAEFRTDQDKDLVKAVKSKHFRRYMKPVDFARRLEGDYGFSITSREESFGWSVYKDEDPHLCRLFATRL